MVNQENFRFIQTLRIDLRHKQLRFNKPAKTSRDVMKVRDVYYIILTDQSTGIVGIGECSPIKGLSADCDELYFQKLIVFSKMNFDFDQWNSFLKLNPSILFGLETALLDLQNGGLRNIFPNIQNISIPINGLVWMNGKEQMLNEAFEKIEAGFKCIKLKIGGLDFEDEINILREIRSHHPSEKVTIRLDANGAFRYEEALIKLEKLAQFDIHSIEQPIKAGQQNNMATIVMQSPIDIALDEELIGINERQSKIDLLHSVMPNFIILKPTLHGGISGCNEWIEIATRLNIDWWATSALESNIGLNAISQWVAAKNPELEQGLGTGTLFENNIPSPIQIQSGRLTYDKHLDWDISGILDASTELI